MNRHSKNFLSFRHWAGISGGLLLIVFGCFYFLHVSAKMEAVENPAEQNLVLGKLAFSVRTSAPAPDNRVVTSNPDGSGQTSLPITGTQSTEPAWSPDGTRLAFQGYQGIPGDIFVINADGSGQTNLTNTTDVSESNPSWSVTGKIAYQQSTQTNGSQIWVMNADGSGRAQFPGITQPSPFAPAWSPDGTKLAFVSGGEIWVINADGTNARRVTMNATTDTDPAWSPDGSKIIFSASGSGINIINADGTNEINLPSLSGDIQPSWSPDGTKIAFRRTATSRGIYTMDANGANQIRILADISNFPQCCDISYENPAWQPVAQTPSTFTISGRVTYSTSPVGGVTINLSGTTNAVATTDAVGNYQFSGLPAGGSYTVSPSFPKFYFTPPNRSFNNLNSNQTGDFEVLAVCQGGKCVKNGKIAFGRDGEIFTINPDGSNQTNITNNPAADGGANYSPDGANIIFNTNRDGNQEVYRMNADGSNTVRLTTNPAADFSAFYSPDGASIVFVSDRDGNYEIYKMNADGTNQVRLTSNAATDYDPAFSPDGSKIIFVKSTNSIGPERANIWIMNADGSNQQPISAPTGISPAYSRPSYSPDGSKIIFTFTPDTSSQFNTTWTMNADGTNRAQFPGVGGLSASYSPDGRKVVLTCCQFDNTHRLRTVNSDGGTSSMQILTPSNAGNSSPDWQGLLVPRAPFDFDGDGRSDISVFRPADGTWYLLPSGTRFKAMQWGISNDVLVPADYDGDLKTDIAVWRPADGNFYILNSFTNTLRGENFGLSGDVPVGGDWDGDGKADPAVYRDGAAQSYFYYRGSMGNPQRLITVIPWGANGDKAVAGDYDGDGRTDAAVFRSGTWYILQSSSGQLAAANFGLAGDRLVPADYDADGKTDVAVYRGGVWYLLRSAQGFAAVQFGIFSDTPAPADYDGDGRTDPAVYRDNTWYLLQSTNGFNGFQFGAAGDKPVPAAFVR